MHRPIPSPFLNPFFRKMGGMLAILLCLGAVCLTACEDDPILTPTDSTDGGGSYGKFEEPDSLHLLHSIPNPETF